MKAKKVLLTTLIATQVLSMTALAASDEAIKEFNKVAPIKQEVKHFQGEVKLFIIKDGEKVRVDQKMTDGLRVVNGRTCVGVRDLVNAIEGAKVEWDGTNHVVDITYAGKTISYPVGKPLMWADGKAVSIDVPAQIDPAISKTFLPIRNIAETLGFKVDWDNKAKEVVLTPGAGKAQTTAQNQPRPTTQTPTQNSATKITLASGEVIDFNNPPKNAKYKLSDADFIDNGDGTVTFGKGTQWEMTTMKRVTRVESSPAHPNFRILGDNGPDDRIGTAIFTQGEESWDKAHMNCNNNIPYWVNKEKNIKATPPFIWFYGVKGTTEKVEKALEPRKIKDEYVKEFIKNVKYIPLGSVSKAKSPFKEGEIFYDATGIGDPDVTSMSSIYGTFTQDMIGNGSEKFFLMTNGELYESGYGEFCEGKTLTIDKIITKYGSKKWLVIDIPNIKHTLRNPYKNRKGVNVLSLDYLRNELRMSEDWRG